MIEPVMTLLLSLEYIRIAPIMTGTLKPKPMSIIAAPAIGIQIINAPAAATARPFIRMRIAPTRDNTNAATGISSAIFLHNKSEASI
jgi:hypothetical protein